jgi:hypothetical protein
VWAIDRKGRSEGKEAPVKRTALIALVFGIVLTVAPAANAMWLSDASGVSSTPVRMTTQQAQFTALHGTVPTYTPSVSVHPDVLGGSGSPASVSIRADVLGGNGGDSAVREIPILTSDDSFAWSDAALGAATTVAAMLLAAAALYTMRRRSQRLSF